MKIHSLIFNTVISFFFSFRAVLGAKHRTLFTLEKSCNIGLCSCPALKDAGNWGEEGKVTPHH